MAMTVIDTHNHVISTDKLRHPLAPVGGHQSDWSVKRPVSHEALIAAMDAAGVAKSVVVQASTAYGHDNSYLVEAVRAHPSRLTGVFSVDVLAPDACAQIRRWVSEGLCGFRLFTTGSTMPGQATWLDDERSFPAWELAETLRLPVCMQMTAQGIPQLRKLLDRFPGVPVVLDHLARPDLSDGPPYALAESLFALSAYPQIFLKLTIRTIEAAASGASTQPEFFAAVLARFGARRVMWGSNYPASDGTMASLLQRAQEAIAGLDEADRAWIFAGTAEAVYPALGALHG
jgi:L-fuconolactonase